MHLLPEEDIRMSGPLSTENGPLFRASTEEGVLMTEPTITVLVPAHNEEDCIADALDAVARQTVAVHEVVVVADNCTDRTAGIARAHGATVFETEGNRHRKAGGLNQALAAYLPRLADRDFVLVTDADCRLDESFAEHAQDYVRQPRYGAVGGIFRGDAGGGFVGHLQRNEYARYRRDVERLRGKCLVVTGTAAMFRVGVLKAVSAARLQGGLPSGDGRGGVYDTSVLTEDNELGFAIQTLRYKIISPRQCTLVTEVMPTWRDLWQQRLRWKRGAVENCVQYGVTRVTWKYWGRQLLTMAGVVVTLLYLSTLAIALSTNSLHIEPIWIGITGIFVLERAITINRLGWRQMLLSASMYELSVDFFLQACHAKAYFDALTRRKKAW